MGTKLHDGIPAKAAALKAAINALTPEQLRDNDTFYAALITALVELLFDDAACAEGMIGVYRDASGKMVFEAKPAGGTGGIGDMLKATYDPTASGKVLTAGVADTAGACSGNAATATNADQVDGQHAAAFAAAGHGHATLPTADEKAALAGTSGVPALGNEYVTDDDPRNSNARLAAGGAAATAAGGAGGTFSTDHVTEVTLDHGVDVDGCVIKDGKAAAARMLDDGAGHTVQMVGASRVHSSCAGGYDQFDGNLLFNGIAYVSASLMWGGASAVPPLGGWFYNASNALAIPAGSPVRLGFVDRFGLLATTSAEAGFLLCTPSLIAAGANGAYCKAYGLQTGALAKSADVFVAGDPLWVDATAQLTNVRPVSPAYAKFAGYAAAAKPALTTTCSVLLGLPHPGTVE